MAISSKPMALTLDSNQSNKIDWLLLKIFPEGVDLSKNKEVWDFSIDRKYLLSFELSWEKKSWIIIENKIFICYFTFGQKWTILFDSSSSNDLEWLVCNLEFKKNIILFQFNEWNIESLKGSGTIIIRSPSKNNQSFFSALLDE